MPRCAVRRPHEITSGEIKTCETLAAGQSSCHVVGQRVVTVVDDNLGLVLSQRPALRLDEVVTHVVDEPTLVETQSRALAQNKTQVVVYDGYYTLSNHVAARLSGREGFARFDLATGDLVRAAHGAPWHAGLLTDL